jgi:hypothetical protein
MVGRPALERACRRAGVDPARFTTADLQRVLPEIESTMRTFLSPEVVAARMAEISKLARG